MPVVVAMSAGAAISSRSGQCGSLSPRLITSEMTDGALLEQQSFERGLGRVAIPLAWSRSSEAPIAPKAARSAGGGSDNSSCHLAHSHRDVFNVIISATLSVYESSGVTYTAHVVHRGKRHLRGRTQSAAASMRIDAVINR
jgi:hypothetical protein